MSLEIGARLGHYEVLGALGAGGMGEVYRARDSRLGREVALKILPEAFLKDPERLARFEREARVLASLNHPHIAQIYGVEEAAGSKALVLELVEGPTLADRIAQGALSVEEALSIASQIAEAFAVAHDAGVVHRDLKPANVKLRDGATVKVLDFGLAKATEPSASSMEAAAATQSPTLTAAATQLGTLLGTAAYMAPEQARGRAVDRRADVWAFGCVVYEMLTGRRAFHGGDVTDTLAAVLRSEPDWEVLPAATPPAIARLLRRCLAKSPDQRLRDLGDARLEIEEALAGARHDAGHGAAAVHFPRTQRLAPVALALAAAGAGIALGILAGRAIGNDAPAVAEVEAAATRTVVELPAAAQLAVGNKYYQSPVLALSPDGRHLAYVADEGNGTRLYHRDLTRREEPRPVPGSEGAVAAFFSPDSTELGYLTDDRVKKVAVGGGAPTTLCQARAPYRGFWVGDVIYFTDAQGLALSQVAAGGGEPSTALSAQRLGGLGMVSSILPGGRAVLVHRKSHSSSSSDWSEIVVAELDSPAESDRVLPLRGFDPRYVSSGHLVFAREGAVLAAPFDLERLELLGDAVPVLSEVAVDPIFGYAHLAFASNGILVSVLGGDLARGRVAWIDRQGNAKALDLPEGLYGAFDLAPDDRRLALQIIDARDHVALRAVDEPGRGRALPSGASAGHPIWSADGEEVAMVVQPEEGGFAVAVQNLRSGSLRELLAMPDPLVVDSWVSPGRLGVFTWTPGRVGVLDVGGSRHGGPAGSAEQDAVRWVRGGTEVEPAGLWGAALSPDGGWLAYASDEGGRRYQVFLERIDGGARRQVSTDTGLEPVWCRRCDELFYRENDRILATRITLEPELEVGTPRAVFDPPDFVDTAGISYRVSSDGQRLYYVRRATPPVRNRVQVVHGWFDELSRLAPPS